MNRQKCAPLRPICKPVLLLCEGQTEYHYFKAFKQNSKLQISFELVDVSGGGYPKMFEKIKSSSGIGYLVRAVFLDLDRYHAFSEEKAVFEKIVAYCNSQNARGLPIILITSLPDFDEFLFLHDMNYKGSRNYLKTIGYSSIAELKADDKVFAKFNNPKLNRSYENALGRLNSNSPILNKIAYKKSSFTATNSIIESKNNYHVHTSNVADFYHLVSLLEN